MFRCVSPVLDFSSGHLDGCGIGERNHDPPAFEAMTSTISQSGITGLEQVSLCNIAVFAGVLQVTCSELRTLGVIVTVYKHGFTEHLSTVSEDNVDSESNDKESSIGNL